jgi:hypothetical protein
VQGAPFVDGSCCPCPPVFLLKSVLLKSVCPVAVSVRAVLFAVHAVQVCLQMETLHPDSFKPQLPAGFESAATIFHRCAGDGLHPCADVLVSRLQLHAHSWG